MIKFSDYQRENKVRLIKQFREDFEKDFGIDLGYGSGFTRAEYFHFGVYEHKKYVHKESLEFSLTNGHTYFVGVENPVYFKVNPNKEEIKEVKHNVEKMFNFLRGEINTYGIYPTFLTETDHFFVFEYYEEAQWEVLEKLTLEDAQFIYEHYKAATKNKKEVVTPFYNQMCHKILRNRKTGAIKIRDIKSLEFHTNDPLGILFYNGRVNEYYMLERRFRLKSTILKPFSLDYPTKATTMVKLF